MNVLFIEDDRMNRRVVKDMLSVAGAEMAEAESAEEGLAMLDSTDYDMLLVDLRMPGMDGMTAIRHIRARSDAKAKVPVIVVTADAGHRPARAMPGGGRRRRAVQAGGDGRAVRRDGPHSGARRGGGRRDP